MSRRDEIVRFRHAPLPRVLLVNPPIYDFTAYDFWLRPYGLFQVAARIQNVCRLNYFNFLVSRKKDAWGRGRYDECKIKRPIHLADIPRFFRRFGCPREQFQDFLASDSPDFVLVQTSMSYWYLGLREVIEDVRKIRPAAKIVLGGPYATLCASHARQLGADLVIEGNDLQPLWHLLSVSPQDAAPYWPQDESGVCVMKISDGCPFHCTYCAVPLMSHGFNPRPLNACIGELRYHFSKGARNIAFYDDALLFKSDQLLIPFLQEVLQQGIRVSFHVPNALNARFVTGDLAHLMVRAGFSGIFLGLESRASEWQRPTGPKILPEEYAAAVNYLKEAGAESVMTYILLGHPDSDGDDVEQSIYFAHSCGSRVILSEFSPVPGTIDGEKCRDWADLEEPLSHNKTAFAIRRLGVETVNRLKQLTHSLNAEIESR